MVKTISIVTTMDTKGQEASYVAELIRCRGHCPLLVDVSPRGPLTVKADYPREVVAKAAGVSLPALLSRRRDEIMAEMGRGAGEVLKSLLAQGKLDGVMGLGGNQGTAIAAIALQALPFGLPKLIVSTVASGNIRPYIGHKDIVMLFSVADFLGGPNTVSRMILTNATGALLGMIENGVPFASAGGSRVVAITALGNTDGAVTVARELLVAKGYEVIVFHASGASGSAMEELITQGMIQSVLDLTTHELLGEIFGDDIYAPTSGRRLEAAGVTGIPQVVGTGGLEYFCFGPPETIPLKYQGRLTHYHNPYNTNVRATPEELERVGQVLAQKLNGAQGPVAVLVPLRGWTYIGSPGGILYDPGGNALFLQALKANLSPQVELIELDTTLNDPSYAQVAVERLAQMMSKL